MSVTVELMADMTIYVTDETRQAIEALARRWGISRSRAIAQAVQMALDTTMEEHQ